MSVRSMLKVIMMNIIDYFQDDEHDNVDGDNDDDYAVTARTAQTQRGSL